MKTLHYTIILFTIVFGASFFTACGDPEIEGCTNAFASNFDSSATKDCCCEYDVQVLIDDLVGDYNYKIRPTDGSSNFSYNQISIAKDDTDAERFVIKDYWLQEVVGTFEDGEFTLESEILDISGCLSQTKGRLWKTEDVLMLEMNNRTWQDSNSQLSEGACNSLEFNDVGELRSL